MHAAWLTASLRSYHQALLSGAANSLAFASAQGYTLSESRTAFSLTNCLIRQLFAIIYTRPKGRFTPPSALLLSSDFFLWTVPTSSPRFARNPTLPLRYVIAQRCVPMWPVRGVGGVRVVAKVDTQCRAHTITVRLAASPPAPQDGPSSPGRPHIELAGCDACLAWSNGA